MKKAYILANFGGPRNLGEVSPFLQALLTDRDVVRTKLPTFLNTILFKRLAKKRAKRVVNDYAQIGGKSPIFDDTEALAKKLTAIWDSPVIPFHRYLPTTHPSFLERVKQLECKTIQVFPLFPQFTYATTGSIARFFEKNLPEEVVAKIRWVKSYPTHPGFIAAYAEQIQNTLIKHQIGEEDACLIFSAHGVPKSFVAKGDPYQAECIASFETVKKLFPKAKSLLSYQSQFGPEEWLRPYTKETCEALNEKTILFVPIAFTSDHIETLFEIETEYLPIAKEKGLSAYRVPALNLSQTWVKAIPQIVEDAEFMNNQMLVRRI